MRYLILLLFFFFPVFGGKKHSHMEDDRGLLKCAAILPKSCVNAVILKSDKKKSSDNKSLTFSAKVQCSNSRKTYQFTHVIPFSKEYKRYDQDYYTAVDDEPAPDFFCSFEGTIVKPLIKKNE